MTRAEAAALARPAGAVLALVLAAVALDFVFRDLSLGELEAAVLRQPTWHILLCLALTAASFACLALYDLVGVHVAAPGRVSARLRRGNHLIAIVPVAAILVASIRLKFTDVLLHLKYRGPNEIPVDARFGKGDEMGGFQHGSTIILFVPPGFEFVDGIATGTRIRMGQALMRLPVQQPVAEDTDSQEALEQVSA